MKEIEEKAQKELYAILIAGTIVISILLLIIFIILWLI